MVFVIIVENKLYTGGNKKFLEILKNRRIKI